MVHDFQDKMFLPYQLMHTTAFFLFLFLFFPTVCCLPIPFVALLPSSHLSFHFHPPLNQALPSLVTRRERREGNYVNFPAPVERNISSVRPREQGLGYLNVVSLVCMVVVVKLPMFCFFFLLRWLLFSFFFSFSFSFSLPLSFLFLSFFPFLSATKVAIHFSTTLEPR
ncbi:hypothetical protein B9Z19DRAFT_406063 [Tuber borchii]|uniref:Transmembrane protein n=1 Tax=Tuber borchii TaxID=42251 RepID=A0A2T6ZH23_TUBBO|nr:hypothetical protein B9Z19DRAFT_406063 [Tuber borchii]